MYFSFPANSHSSTGQTDVYTTFALQPPTPDEAGYGAVQYDITGHIVGPGGGSVAVTGFSFSNSATGRTYTEQELASMGQENAEAAVDSRKSTVSVASGGTSVFLTEADFVNDEEYMGVVYHQDFACSSKAFINLTADGASTRQYLTSGLELVPMDELANVHPASTMRVKALLNGSPVAGLDIYVSYEGCPANAELHGDVSAMRAVTTGSDGIATLVLPSRPGNTYLFAMYLGPGTTDTNFEGAMASLSFATAIEEDEMEADASHLLFSGNAAGLGTPIMCEADTVDYLRTALGMVWANDLVEQVAGTSAFVSGMNGQLAGKGTGARFTIPMDITGASVKGVIGTEQLLELTPDIVGQSTFNDMVLFLTDAYANTPDRFVSGEGLIFYCPYTAKDFFDNFGIAVMGYFSDGATLDITDNFMLGVVYDEDQFENGSIAIVYGTLYLDSAPTSDGYTRDLTSVIDPSGFTKVPLLYDGASDGKLQMTYWLATKGISYDSGSSGCNAGIPLGILLVFACGAVFKTKKKN